MDSPLQDKSFHTASTWLEDEYQDDYANIDSLGALELMGEDSESALNMARYQIEALAKENHRLREELTIAKNEHWTAEMEALERSQFLTPMKPPAFVRGPPFRSDTSLRMSTTPNQGDINNMSAILEQDEPFDVTQSFHDSKTPFTASKYQASQRAVFTPSDSPTSRLMGFHSYPTPINMRPFLDAQRRAFHPHSEGQKIEESEFENIDNLNPEIEQNLPSSKSPSESPAKPATEPSTHGTRVPPSSRKHPPATHQSQSRITDPIQSHQLQTRNGPFSTHSTDRHSDREFSNRILDRSEFQSSKHHFRSTVCHNWLIIILFILLMSASFVLGSKVKIGIVLETMVGHVQIKKS